MTNKDVFSTHRFMQVLFLQY